MAEFGVDALGAGIPVAGDDVQSSENGALCIDSIERLKIRDRRMALTLLKIVGDFFRQTEPHSPVSYSIDQLLRWSEMPLSALIKELIPEDNARRQFQLLTGMLSDSDVT